VMTQLVREEKPGQRRHHGGQCRDFPTK
jgi:hypothetical protein